MSQRFDHMQEKLKNLQINSETAGLKINIKKTKEFRINPRPQKQLMIGEQAIESVNTFTYLRSIVTPTGGTVEDVVNRI